MRFLFLTIFSLLSYALMALPITIYGHSGAANNFVFRLYVQEDAISGLKKVADQERPDENGDFMLGFEAQNIQEVSIMVGMQSMSFFVIPGQSYYLNFDKITLENQNVFLPQEPLAVQFKHEDLLNIAIDGFNYDYQNFIEKNFLRITKYREHSKFKAYETAVWSKFQETPFQDTLAKKFFENYISYRLADIQLATHIKKKEELALKYLTHQTISMNNPAYTDFFIKYFKNYLSEWNGGSSLDEIKTLLNKQADFKHIDDILGKNPVLVEEKIRELVFLYILKQSYYKKSFSKKAINTFLEDRALYSKYSQHRKIAQHLKTKLNRFEKGNKLPSFNLKDMHGQEKNWQSYKGKPTYLMFVNPNCQTCEMDIRIIKNLMKEYSNLIQFVAIYTGYDQEKSKEWVEKQKANWDFLWFKNNYSLLNEYHIKTYPKYILADENGQVSYYFPPKPRENLAAYLKSLRLQKEKPEEKPNDLFRSN